MPKDYDHDWRHKDDEWEEHDWPMCDCYCSCPLYAIVGDECNYCADGHHYDEELPL